MDKYHLLLQKQIDQCACMEDCFKLDGFIQFIQEIDSTYNDFEEDKKLLERSIEISSKEFLEHFEKTKKMQAQMIHNEKMAGIGQLSAGIAHEINNPLGFIHSNIDTLKKYMMKVLNMQKISQQLIMDAAPNQPEEYQANCETMKEYIRTNNMDYIFHEIPDIIEETTIGISRIERIIKGLLGFSRINYESDKTDFDLNKGILDTLIIANNEIKYCAGIITDLQNIPLIKAQSGEINQVILNILINAAHAIKSKDEALEKNYITIHTYCDQKYVHCDIEDTGTGIPDNIRDRIYEPFFTTKPVGSGTGLGLSMAHDIIVNKHHGQISVESLEGNGTKFLIMLPY